MVADVEPGSRCTGSGRASTALSWRDVLIGLIAGCLVVTALASRVQLRSEGTAEYADPGWDRHLYIAMANTGPFDFGIAPYNRRVLVPAVARVLPGDLQAGFAATTMTAGAVAFSCLYLLGRARGHGRLIALSGTLLVASLGWGLKYAVADFWIPDATVLAFVAAGLVFATRRMPLAFAICIAIGVLAKESVVFVAPLFYTLNARAAVDRGVLLVSALAAIPAALILVFFQMTIPERNGDALYIASLPEVISRFPELYANYDYVTLLRDIGYRQRFLEADGPALLAATIRPYGLILLAFCAFALPRHWRFALRLSPFILLVYIQLLFATDTERLLALAAPALACLAMLGMDELGGRARWLPLVCAVVATAAFGQGLIVPNAFDMDLRQQAVLLGVFATPAAVVAWWRPSPTPARGSAPDEEGRDVARPS
jgi:hypothetical protein